MENVSEKQLSIRRIIAIGMGLLWASMLIAESLQGQTCSDSIGKGRSALKVLAGYHVHSIPSFEAAQKKESQRLRAEIKEFSQTITLTDGQKSHPSALSKGDNKTRLRL